MNTSDMFDPARMLETLGDIAAVWRWDMRTDRVVWSRKLCDMLGLHPEAFGGTFDAFLHYLHPDDLVEVKEKVAQHLETGAPFVLEVRFLHARGHFVTVLAKGQAILAEDGTPHQFVGTLTDISEQTRTVADLMDTERSLRSLADNVPGAIFRYRLNDDGTDEIRYMSPGCFDIWEISAEEIQGDPSRLWDVILEEDLPAMQASVQDSARNVQPWRHHWRIRTPSGKLKHLDGRGVPTSEPDGSILWDSLILDVSQLYETRQELLGQQEMLLQVQKHEAIGRIAGGIAHDFNNLLAIIQGCAELQETAESLTEVVELTPQILKACQRGSELTRRMLSFAGKSQLHPEPIDCNAVIDEMHSIFKRVLPETIEVRTGLARDLSPANVDKSYLESALLNLAINARDAMPGGGALVVSTRNVLVPEGHADPPAPDLSPGPYVEISVQDTGTGIPPENLTRVIEPFFSTKTPDKGSGLGLAMIHGFAHQSSGDLVIESEMGTGTTVSILLPAVAPPSLRADVAPERARPEQAHVAGLVMIVEDEKAILDLQQRTLQRAGYVVHAAGSGDAALELLKATDFVPDVLLTDIVLPGKLQGPAVAERLRALIPHLQVVFTSGYAGRDTNTAADLPAFDRYLAKPVRRGELLDAIARASADAREQKSGQS